MARNRVQFQKGLSEKDFEALYGSEEKCRTVIVTARWPNGFVCPHCGGRRHSHITSRDKFQCSACRKQTSPIAGTIFAASKAPLAKWFRAIYHLTQSKQGMSSIELGRRLGVTQTTAWKMKTKLAEVMRRSGESLRLEGRVEMDDVFLGGHRPGGKVGRGAAGKTPFVAAVETTPDKKPKRIRLKRIARFKRKRIKSLAKRVVAAGSTVVTDGLSSFRGIPTPASHIRSLSQARATAPPRTRPSQPSTPSSATSRVPSPAPTAPCAASTFPVTSPSSNGASTIAPTSQP